MNTDSIKVDIVKNTVKRVKAAANIALLLMKLRLGDQMFTPRMNIVAAITDVIPLIKKHELIISVFFSALGIKRTSAISRPSGLSNTSNEIADMIALARPISALS
jgi:hypothetical protein